MIKKLDLWIVFALCGIVLFGLFNLIGIKPDLILQQVTFYIVGSIALYIFYRLGPEVIRSNSFLIYLVMCGLLIFVSVVAPSVRGSSRWIDFTFFKLQPSELFRPFFLVMLCHLFARKQREHSHQEFLRAVLLSIIPIALIMHQPDLGNAILYSLILPSTLYYVGISTKFFIGLTILGIVSSPIVWSFLHRYQKLRIIGFLNPEADPQGISYNLLQSIIAVGSGNLWGKGLGLGTQSQLQFLPEYHTDFAFASLVEQFGFVGGLLVIIFFAILIFRLVSRAIALKHDLYPFLFLLGTATILFASVVVNIGMNIGLLPVTGVALPLISYGGSSILSTFILIGMALSL